MFLADNIIWGQHEAFRLTQGHLWGAARDIHHHGVGLRNSLRRRARDEVSGAPPVFLREPGHGTLRHYLTLLSNMLT